VKVSRQRGFTLVELVIAMTIMALISLALYGVVGIGARAASIGERRTEQSRRFRIATSLMVRQLRSAVPLECQFADDDETLPFFLGEEDRVDFITSQPQSPTSSGLAIVSYWLEDGMLKMSELPYYAYCGGDPPERDDDQFNLEVPLLYDVHSVTFEYCRACYDDDSWENKWDASDDDSLPAAVHIVIEPEKDGGPSWDREVPVFVAVMNEITGSDDFRRPGRR